MMLTITDIKKFAQQHQKKNAFKKRERVREVKQLKMKGRHVVWAQHAQYDFISTGIPFENEYSIDRYFKENLLKIDYFYIVRNKDPEVQRNQEIPKYEALYKCTHGNYYVKVQKCHLKQAYVNSNRCDRERIWEVLGDGTPYWVDRYAFSKKKQKDSKQRYEIKKIKRVG